VIRITPWAHNGNEENSRYQGGNGYPYCDCLKYRLTEAADGQPDASFTGGLGEFMKVAAMLESRGRKIATHSWVGGGSLMQNIHAGFACGNTAVLEIAPNYAGLHSEVMCEPLVLKDGYILAPKVPGLGIKLTDVVKNKYPFVRGSGEFNSVPGKILVD